jgi:hypothetical protein
VTIDLHQAKLLEEVVASVILAEKPKFRRNLREGHITVVSDGDVNLDGYTVIGPAASSSGARKRYLSRADPSAIAKSVAKALNRKSSQSAVIGSYEDQVASWTSCE